jgi:hypothetical protein
LRTVLCRVGEAWRAAETAVAEAPTIRAHSAADSVPVAQVHSTTEAVDSIRRSSSRGGAPVIELPPD